MFFFPLDILQRRACAGVGAVGADLGGVGVGGGGASVPAPRLARRPSQPRLVEVALSVLVGLPVPNEVVFDVPVGINRGSGGGAQPAA